VLNNNCVPSFYNEVSRQNSVAKEHSHSSEITEVQLRWKITSLLLHVGA